MVSINNDESLKPSSTTIKYETSTSSIQDDSTCKHEESNEMIKIDISDDICISRKGSCRDMMNEKQFKSVDERLGKPIKSQERKMSLLSNIKDSTYNHKKWSSSNIKHMYNMNEDIINRINYIYTKFIVSFSDYELNLTSKVIKKITEFINVIPKNHEAINAISVSGTNFENLFDEAYDEVLDTLYLNIYMQYAIKKQNKSKNST